MEHNKSEHCFNQNLARGISSDCSNRIKLGSLTALDRIITPQDSLLNCFRFLNLVQEFLYPVIKIKKSVWALSHSVLDMPSPVKERKKKIIIVASLQYDCVCSCYK